MLLEEPTRHLTKGEDLHERTYGRPLTCLAIPVLIISLGLVTDTLNYNKDCAYANYFAAEDFNLGKLRTIAQDAVGLTRGYCIGWKAFRDSNPEWSYLKLKIDCHGEALRGKSARRAPSVHVIPRHLLCNCGKSTEKPQTGY
jgi:hypothetical protein